MTVQRAKMPTTCVELFDEFLRRAIRKLEEPCPPTVSTPDIAPTEGTRACKEKGVFPMCCGRFPSQMLNCTGLVADLASAQLFFRFLGGALETFYRRSAKQSVARSSRFLTVFSFQQS